MQGDRGLAGPWSTLDEQELVGWRGDDVVLCGLDSLDDRLHFRRAPSGKDGLQEIIGFEELGSGGAELRDLPCELREEQVVQVRDRVDRLGAVGAPAHDPAGFLVCRSAKTQDRGCLPAVDQEVGALVGDGVIADVQALAVLGVESEECDRIAW